MKLAWLTDIHLNFIDTDAVDRFCREIADTGADAVLIGGDIAESRDVADWLGYLDERLSRPIYFVLGNHDYYGSSVEQVRERIREFVRSSKRLRWLNTEEGIRLTDRCGLVGVDGWGDARYGNHERSSILVSDFVEITDLVGLDKVRLGMRLRELGDREADHVGRVLPRALDQFEHVLFLTHVPPFIEACWYEGKTSDENWAPYFSCKAVGDVLIESMRRRPDRHMTVLCGHTHSPGEAHLLPNLHVRTGGARYGEPRIQRPLIEV